MILYKIWLNVAIFCYIETIKTCDIAGLFGRINRPKTNLRAVPKSRSSEYRVAIPEREARNKNLCRLLVGRHLCSLGVSLVFC